LVFESLEGFSAKLPPVAVQALCRSPKVDLVAPNGWVGRASHQALIDAVETARREGVRLPMLEG
jgi:hypothetical protein